MPVSTYSDELAEEFLKRFSEIGNIKTTCLGADMPSAQQVHTWLREIPKFRDGYDGAYRVYADQTFQEVIGLADGVALEANAISAARLQIDTRFKSIVFMNRGKYGPRTEISGPDGAAIPTRTDLSKLSTEELVALKAILYKDEDKDEGAGADEDRNGDEDGDGVKEDGGVELRRSRGPYTE